MAHFNLSDGLYLIKQKCHVKGILVDHYAVLDVGNRLRFAGAGNSPVIIHQTPPRIRTDWLENTGRWNVIGQIMDEAYAIGRMNKALENDAYDLFGNNCEHFARYVATGSRESSQLRTVGLIVGIVAATVVIANLGDGS